MERWKGQAAHYAAQLHSAGLGSQECAAEKQVGLEGGRLVPVLLPRAVGRHGMIGCAGVAVCAAFGARGASGGGGAHKAAAAGGAAGGGAFGTG